MKDKCTHRSLEEYRTFLRNRDMKPNTVTKYIRDMAKFLAFLQGSCSRTNPGS